MNDQAVKASLDRFMKKVNFTAHREIEKAIRNALANGTLKGHEAFMAGVTLTSEKVGLDITLYTKIELT